MKSFRPLRGKKLLPNFVPLFILTIVMIQIPGNLDAQKQELDVVYLNTGEIYRGHLKEHLNPDFIQLETICLNTRIFSRNDVIRIENEKINPGTFRRITEIPLQGYFNRTDLGALIGSGNNQSNVLFSLQMVNGYKFGRRYHPGLGIGLEFFDYAVIPIYADFTYALTDTRVSPFLRTSFGYSVPVEKPREEWGRITKNQGGLLFTAGVGTSIRTGSSSALVISLLYRFQSLKSVYTEEWTDNVYNIDKQFNRIALRIGFMFD